MQCTCGEMFVNSGEQQKSLEKNHFIDSCENKRQVIGKLAELE